jgi:hypothetical protein
MSELRISWSDDVQHIDNRAVGVLSVAQWPTGGIGELLIEGVSESDLDGFTAISGVNARAVVQGLHRRGLLSFDVDGVTARPLAVGIPWPQMREVTDSRLSRFALIRREGECPVLESARSLWAITMAPDQLTLLMCGEFLGEGAALLAGSGMLADSDQDAASLSWSLHERYFASRSRLDMRVTAPAVHSDGPAPQALPRRVGEPIVALSTPPEPSSDEPSLWAATESRRTVRHFAAAPVSLDALSHLLWRTVRVVEVLEPDSTDAPSYSGLLKPIPSGGAMHANDLWLWTERVEGLPVALWWYDPQAHALVHVRSDVPRPPLVPFGPVNPPVSAVLTARHERTAWKYGQISFALELKDAGVVMHAMQLTAGALGLGVCLVGSGLTAALAQTLRVDPEVDVTVGEFVIGVPG